MSFSLLLHRLNPNHLALSKKMRQGKIHKKIEKNCEKHAVYQITLNKNTQVWKNHNTPICNWRNMKIQNRIKGQVKLNLHSLSLKSLTNMKNFLQFSNFYQLHRAEELLHIWDSLQKQHNAKASARYCEKENRQLNEKIPTFWS